MSKFFYKGSRVNMQDTRGTGYNPNKTIRVGVEGNPALVTVNSEEREAELLALAQAQSIVVEITVDAESEEDTRQLDALLATGKTLVKEKAPSRNDPCPCGSGKKYKKCCGA